MEKEFGTFEEISYKEYRGMTYVYAKKRDSNGDYKIVVSDRILWVYERHERNIWHATLCASTFSVSGE